ncbi:MAG: S-layer homology domain-containing protein, partial [Clostridia bacterium]|nr:S-layer homology domain-containing protein [Clostridia bacterium]
MNRIIKKISLVLTLVMLVLTIPFGTNIFAAEESVYSLSQGEEGLLRYLGIIDETVINYEKQITRGELAHIAAGVANIKDTAVEKQAFYDVEADHKYYQEICALAQMGIVAGNGFGYFMPDGVVGDAEISKIFASILGYRETGHYGSYIGVAKSAGILDGVQMDNIVTYGEALEMAYNTLHCSMVEVFFRVDGTSYSYTVNEGYLAVEYYYDLVMQKGILEGADGTDLISVNDKVELGKVLINDKLYKYASADALLGQAVVFYTKRLDRRTGETSDVIDYIHSNSRNNIITINPDDIILAETSYDELSYYKNDKKVKAELGAAVKCVINGIAYDGDFIGNGKVKPNAGTVTLVDNNFDEKYDVILIESYHYVLAKSVDDERGVVQYERNAAGVAGEWNFSDREEIRMVVSDNGRKILPSSLSGGTPIVVKVSENTEGLLKIDVQPLRAVVEGPVEAMSISGGYITVAGKKFELANSSAFVKNVDRINLNDNVQVYTHLGKCVAVVHSAGDEYVHGWLVGAWKETAAFSESLNFRIINRDRTVSDYVSKERLVIDNVGYKNADTILTKLNEAARTMINYDASYPQWQMIRYKLDSAGNVSHIDTVLAGTILSENELYGVVDSAMAPVTHSIETGKAEDQYLRDSYLGGS